MTSDTARRAIDFLLAASGRSPQVQVIFFGGEPLLNRALIQTVMEYATERATALGKAVRYSLSTNGLLIDRRPAATIIGTTKYTKYTKVGSPYATHPRD